MQTLTPKKLGGRPGHCNQGGAGGDCVPHSACQTRHFGNHEVGTGGRKRHPVQRGREVPVKLPLKNRIED